MTKRAGSPPACDADRARVLDGLIHEAYVGASAEALNQVLKIRRRGEVDRGDRGEVRGGWMGESDSPAG
jgi:hypothetical protein